MPRVGLPQANSQHPVPQNIMDVEFKLIGDLTMRQFAYLFVAGISAYLSYLLVIGLFKWPTVIFLILLGIGLAFVPVEERGLDEWIVNFFRAINSQTQKVWRKEPQLPTAFLYDSIAVVKQEMITLAPTSSRRKLEEYLRYKGEDEKEDPLDIPEKEYAMKVRAAYPNVPRTVSKQVGVMVDEPLIEQPEVEIPEEIAKEEPKFEKIEFEEKELEVEKSIEPPRIEQKSVVEVKPEMEVAAQPGKPVSSAIKAIKKIVTQPIVGKLKEIKTDKREKFVLPERFTGKEDEYNYKPMTPDMHSGRTFVNLVPSSGELVLPIRGERILRTSEETETDDGLKEKASQLEELLKKIRREEGLPEIPKEMTAEYVSEAGVGQETKDVVEKLKQQNDELNKEIEKLRDQINKGKSLSLETETQEQLLKRLESQKETLASSYTELRKQVQDLQKKLGDKTTTSTGPEFISQKQNTVSVLTDKPNVLTGVVKDSANRFLSDTLMIVKNSRGEAIRAFKTNILGQFIVITPLQNGTYTVEVSPVNKTSLTFDIIPIEVKGEVLPPLEIVGK